MERPGPHCQVERAVEGARYAAHTSHVRRYRTCLDQVTMRPRDECVPLAGLRPGMTRTHLPAMNPGVVRVRCSDLGYPLPYLCGLALQGYAPMLFVSCTRHGEVVHAVVVPRFGCGTSPTTPLALLCT